MEETLFEVETLQDWQAETAANQVVVLPEGGSGCNNSNSNAGDEP